MIESAPSGSSMSLPSFKEMGFSNEDLYGYAFILLVPTACGILILCLIALKKRLTNGYRGKRKY